MVDYKFKQMHLCADFHAGQSKEYLIFFLFILNLTTIYKFKTTKSGFCLFLMYYLDCCWAALNLDTIFVW